MAELTAEQQEALAVLSGQRGDVDQATLDAARNTYYETYYSEQPSVVAAGQEALSIAEDNRDLAVRNQAAGDAFAFQALITPDPFVKLYYQQLAEQSYAEAQRNAATAIAQTSRYANVIGAPKAIVPNIFAAAQEAARATGLPVPQIPGAPEAPSSPAPSTQPVLGSGLPRPSVMPGSPLSYLSGLPLGAGSIGAAAPARSTTPVFIPSPGTAVPSSTQSISRGVSLKFVPVVTGEPISTVVATIGSIIFGIFGIFGAISGAVKTALEKLRDGLNFTARSLTDFAWRGLNAIGRVLAGLHAIWVRVIHPILERVVNLSIRLARIVDRVLKPYLDTLRRIHDTIIRIYERWLRPVLQAIETVRRVVAILRLLRVPFAKEVDNALRRVEAKIMQPLLIALQHLAWLEQWVNVLLSYRWVIQGPIFRRSLWSNRNDIVNIWWWHHTGALQKLVEGVTPAGPAAIALKGDEADSAARAAVVADSGPWASSADQAISDMRRALGV